MKEAEHEDTEHTMPSLLDRQWGFGDELSLAILRLARQVPHVDALAREYEREQSEVA